MRRSVLVTGLALTFPALQLAAAAGARNNRFLARAGPVTEVRLQRTACFGTCPVDEVVLRTDGTASYCGERFVDRVGRYRGSVPPEQLAQLARQLQEARFFRLKAR